MNPVDQSASEWPAEGLEQVANCPVCGSADRSLLYDRLSDRVFFVAPGIWTMWRCEDCRSGYLDPRPNEQTIGRAYQRYFTHDSESGPPRPPHNKFERIRAKLANGYRNARYGAHFECASAFGRYLGEIPPLGWPVDSRYRYLPRRPGRVLDIGAGGGHWLELARDGGWLAAGAEPDPIARAGMIARGFDARASSEEWLKEGQTFDFVTMNHVIEHVHDPNGLLAIAFRLLTPGGQLFVETPNIDASGRDIYGRDWLALDSPRHLLLFNRTSLRNAFATAGFRKIKFRGRPSPFAETSLQSRRIAAGLDPFGTGGILTIPAPTRFQSLTAALTRSRSEYITITATKPG